MNAAIRLDSMLEIICTDCLEVLSENIDVALGVIADSTTFEGMRELFQYSISDNTEKLSCCLEAAAMSDVFYFTCQSILADDAVEFDELQAAAELLSVSIHRYCWLERYRPFKYLSDGDDVRELLATWQNDGGWFGGNQKAGALVRPFNDFVLLACIVSDSPSLYQMYVKISLLIAKLVLEAGGVASEEQVFYDDLSSSLRRTEEAITDALQTPGGSSLSRTTSREDQLTGTSNTLAPEEALKQGLTELSSLIGVSAVKSEIQRLANFLKIRQQRIEQGMAVPSQSLHFVFTGNPGTGKTTVARIVAKILYGFQILNTPNMVEADRATMVGGYVGQTAIKTNEVIENARNGVLFIDEAYTLSKSKGEDYGQEAIDSLLKKMEDLRDCLVVIVAGYPQKMTEFISSNPGLESRFTKYIHFDDYHVSDLCQIFEHFCGSSQYHLTQEARANLAIILNRAFVNREENFGNARFVRNAYEHTIGNQSDRLATTSTAMTKDILQTIEAVDLPYNIADGISGPFDVSQSKWIVKCPHCEKVSRASLHLIGQVVKCKCEARFRCPWWNLDKKTVPGLVGFEKFERPLDLIGYEVSNNTHR